MEGNADIFLATRFQLHAKAAGLQVIWRKEQQLEKPYIYHFQPKWMKSPKCDGNRSKFLLLYLFFLVPCSLQETTHFTKFSKLQKQTDVVEC